GADRRRRRRRPGREYLSLRRVRHRRHQGLPGPARRARPPALRPPRRLNMATADADQMDADQRPDPKPAAELRKEPEGTKPFRMVMKHEGSDLHLKVGLPPMMRLRGDIRRMDMRPLTQEDMERLLLPQLKPHHRKILDDEGGVDFSYVIGADESRFRVSLF